MPPKPARIICGFADYQLFKDILSEAEFEEHNEAMQPYPCMKVVVADWQTKKYFYHKVFNTVQWNLFAFAILTFLTRVVLSLILFSFIF